MTKLCNISFANFIDSLATLTASPMPFPGSGAKTGTFNDSPTICNWVTAFGRCRSAATRSGVLPSTF